MMKRSMTAHCPAHPTTRHQAPQLPPTAFPDPPLPQHTTACPHTPTEPPKHHVIVKKTHFRSTFPQQSAALRTMVRKVLQRALVLASLMMPPVALAKKTYPYGVEFSGDGTFYGAVSPGDGHCAIEDPLPDMYHGMIPMAVSLGGMYDSSMICGACIEGTGTGGGSGHTPIKGKFKGFVSDSCPECSQGDLDFAKGGDGRWDITWRFVECPRGGKPSFIFEGSNKYYWKIQGRGTKSPVTELHVNGKPAKKTIDNFFEATEGAPFNGRQYVETTTLLGDTEGTYVSL